MQGSYNELSRTNDEFANVIDSIKMTVESRRQSEIPISEVSPIERRISKISYRGRASVQSNASSVVIITRSPRYAVFIR